MERHATHESMSRSRFPDGFRYMRGKQEYVTYRERSSLRVWYSETPWHYESHYHSAVEVIMPIKGEVIYSLLDSTYRVQVGEVLIVPPNCIHDLTDTPDHLISIMEECKKTGNIDLPICFCSTSKITFPGSGVAAMAASDSNMKVIKNKYKYQTIGYDKINMLRHVRFFGNPEGILAHMQKHRAILEPRFNLVLDKLGQNLDELGIIRYLKPNGGYFVCVDVLDGTAKRVVALCKEAGVTLTNAGATYPYGKDPHDSNIRIAPTFPSLEDLDKAMDIFCTCTKLAACEKLLEEK